MSSTPLSPIDERRTLRDTAISLLINMCFLLSFFSYLRLLPLAAENQPIAAGIALVVVLLFGLPVDPKTWAVAGLAVVAIFHTLLALLGTSDLIAEIVLNGFGYIAPLVVFLAIWRFAGHLSAALFESVVWFCFVVGLIQSLDALEALRPTLDTVLGSIFSRFVAGRFEDRGVGLIFSEPAVAAYYVLLFFCTTLVFAHQGKLTRRRTYVLLLLQLVMGYQIQSGTLFILVAFVAAAVAISAFCVGRLRLALQIPLSIVLFAAAVIALNGAEVIEMPRLNALIATASSMELHDWHDALTYSVLAGGHRLPSLLVGYGGFLQEPWGRGPASWLSDLSMVSEFLNIDLYALPLAETDSVQAFGYVKPAAYGAAVALDFGILGLLALATLLGFITRDAARAPAPVRVWSLTLALLGTFIILVHGVVLSLVPWILLAFACHLARPLQQRSRSSDLLAAVGSK